MVKDLMAVPTLASFLLAHPGIQSWDPSSPDFESTTAPFFVQPHKPSQVLRPATIDDVAALIAHLGSAKTPFAIRVGAHDTNGRSIVANTLQIDLRSIKHISVDPLPHSANGDAQQRTAKVGGGVLNADLLKLLDAHGLMTPTGTVGSVGYPGWAMYGGYSPLSSLYGLGVDQIVGARIVTAEGAVRDADESVLEGLRGGGGCFCVVVELIIKVYPKQEVSLLNLSISHHRVAQSGLTCGRLQLQASTVTYDSPSPSETVERYFTGLSSVLASEINHIPNNMDIMTNITFDPSVAHHVVSLWFTYVGPYDETCKRWHAKLLALPNLQVLESSIKTESYLQCVQRHTSLVPPKLYAGRSHTVTLRGITVAPATVSILAEAFGRPGAGVMPSHVLHGPLAEKRAFPSVFGTQGAHMLLEIVGAAAFPDPAAAEQAGAWGDQVFEELRQRGEGVLKGKYYPSQAMDKDMKGEEVFGVQGWQTLRRLKKEMDPDNVFRHTIPSFAEG
jgi:FAD/FMN-containing dehydrogenase